MSCLNFDIQSFINIYFEFTLYIHFNLFFKRMLHLQKIGWLKLYLKIIRLFQVMI